MERSILWVEGDLAASIRFSDALCSAGLGVSLTWTGRDAVCRLCQGPRPDAVVIGSNLEDITGLDLARQIRRLPGLGTLPLVLLGAWHAPAELKGFMGVGLDAYLPRELPPAEFARALAVVLDEAQERSRDGLAPGTPPHARMALALARAVDARDARTYEHSLRVSELALGVGRRLGLLADELEELRLGALLHDVGKIGIGDELLKWRGALSDQERRIVQSHAVLGEAIVVPVGFPPGVVSIVRHHHEDFDGGGYPDGLAGGAISLDARVVRVADAYEAMTSERVYRAARSAEEAAAELRAHAGKQFDPALVEQLIAVVGGEDPIDPGRAGAGADAAVMPRWAPLRPSFQIG